MNSDLNFIKDYINQLSFCTRKEKKFIENNYIKNIKRIWIKKIILQILKIIFYILTYFVIICIYIIYAVSFIISTKDTVLDYIIKSINIILTTIFGLSKFLFDTIDFNGKITICEETLRKLKYRGISFINSDINEAIDFEMNKNDPSITDKYKKLKIEQKIKRQKSIIEFIKDIDIIISDAVIKYRKTVNLDLKKTLNKKDKILALQSFQSAGNDFFGFNKDDLASTKQKIESKYEKFMKLSKKRLDSSQDSEYDISKMMSMPVKL